MPYVVSRKVVGLAETAAAFGVSERELVDDLNMLWCVELRSPDPYCPIDLSYEGGEIVVSEAESIDRPLRLGVDEASALLVALRMLAEIGRVAAIGRPVGAGPHHRQAGGRGRRGRRGQRPGGRPGGHGARRPCWPSSATRWPARRRLHLSYYVPGRDEATERDVDPMRLVMVDGRSYLEGWCRRAEAVRLFRLDRMLGLEVLDVAAEVPAGGRAEWTWTRACSGPSAGDLGVVLELAPRAAGWPSTTRARGRRSWATGGCG